MHGGKVSAAVAEALKIEPGTPITTISFQRPIAPHDCTGPVVLIASLHLALNAPNAIFQEVVRAYYTGWYRELVTELPRIENGFAHLMTQPGLGTELNPAVRQRSDVTVRRSEVRQ